MRVRKAISRIYRELLIKVMNLASDEELKDLLVETAKRRATSMKPGQGLRFLFSIDVSLYPLQGKLAVAYGGGVHPKHRHMEYHKFFAQRIRENERVLDVGCGIGLVAFHVASITGAEVVGIDRNPNHISLARQRYSHPRVRYMVGDILKDLPNEHFDTVILSNILEHLPKRAHFLRMLQSHIQPTRYLIRVPRYDRHWSVPLKQELGVEWRLDPTHETEYTLESFDKEIKEAGLRVVHVEIRWGEIWAEVVPSES